jgi:hypothetical protein
LAGVRSPDSMRWDQPCGTVRRFCVFTASEKGHAKTKLKLGLFPILAASTSIRCGLRSSSTVFWPF